MNYLKAIFAAAFAAIGSTETAYVAGNGHIGVIAGLTIAGATLSAAAVVWGVPNIPKPPQA